VGGMFENLACHIPRCLRCLPVKNAGANLTICFPIVTLHMSLMKCIESLSSTVKWILLSELRLPAETKGFRQIAVRETAETSFAKSLQNAKMTKLLKMTKMTKMMKLSKLPKLFWHFDTFSYII